MGEACVRGRAAEGEALVALARGAGRATTEGAAEGRGAEPESEASAERGASGGGGAHQTE